MILRDSAECKICRTIQWRSVGVYCTTSNTRQSGYRRLVSLNVYEANGNISELSGTAPVYL